MKIYIDRLKKTDTEQIFEILDAGFLDIHEPRPEERGMIWKGLRTPPKCGFELPGPKGPGFPFLDEEELIFEGKVTISGQAYLANNHLILDLKIKACAKMPCSICNEPMLVPIEVTDFIHTVELCEIPSAIYDFSGEPRPEGRGMIWKGLRTPPKCNFELPGPKGPGFPFLDEVRSALLLKIPQFLECQKGNCPQRKELNKFLKTIPEETYTPFSELYRS